MEFLRMLNELDLGDKKDWSEIEIWEELKKFIPDDKSKIPHELLNELIAFELTEYSDSEVSPW